MAKEKLPKHTEAHEGEYRVYLQRYGTNKTGVANANKAFLENHDVEDTDKNRDTLRKRMQHVITDPQLRKISENLRSAQNTRQATYRQKLQQFLERVENSDHSEYSARDVIEIYNTFLKLDDHQAKLYGLYKNETAQDTQQSTDTEDTEQNTQSDALREVDKLLEAFSEDTEQKD